MSLAKVAQVVEDNYDVDDELDAFFADDSLYIEDDNNFADVLFGNDFDDDSEALDENDLQGEVTLQIGDEDPVTETFEFSLPQVPGGENQDDIEEEPVELEVEEEVEIGEPDMWNWSGNKTTAISGFPSWLSRMMQGVPRHSGHDTVGLERAISYLNAIDKEISKAVRSDLKSELDIGTIEKARDELQGGCDRLSDRLDKIINSKRPKKKKKAGEEAGLIKEAQKITGVHGVMVTVPLLISRIARVCINGMVSAGHDIEDMYKRQAELYKLNTREKAEVLQLLEDMGYAMRRDRGIHPDEEIIRGRSDNFDWMAQYHA